MTVVTCGRGGCDHHHQGITTRHLPPVAPQSLNQSLDDIVVSVPQTPAHGAVARLPSQVPQPRYTHSLAPHTHARTSNETASAPKVNIRSTTHTSTGDGWSWINFNAFVAAGEILKSDSGTNLRLI